MGFYPLVFNKSQKIINNCLRLDWLPEQVCGWLDANNIIKLHHESIYHYLLKNKASGGLLYQPPNAQISADSQVVIKQTNTSGNKNEWMPSAMSALELPSTPVIISSATSNNLVVNNKGLLRLLLKTSG